MPVVGAGCDHSCDEGGDGADEQTQPTHDRSHRSTRSRTENDPYVVTQNDGGQAVWAPTGEDDQWEWTSATDDSPTQLRTLWLQAVARSEAAVDQALAHHGLDRRLAISDWSDTPTMRRVLVDMIEEYARHTGHADLIRESIDGLVGEDAPR